MSRKETKDHRAINQIEDHLGIELFANLSPQDASLPHHARRIPACIQKSFAKYGKKPWIALTLRNKLTEKPAQRRFIKRSNGLQLLGKIHNCRSRVRHHDARVHPPKIRIEGHEILVRPPFVNRCLAHASTLRDRFRGHLTK